MQETSPQVGTEKVSDYQQYQAQYADSHKRVAAFAEEFFAAGKQKTLTGILADMHEKLAKEIQTEYMGGFLPEHGATPAANEVARTFMGLSDAVHSMKGTQQFPEDFSERRFYAEWNIGTAKLTEMIDRYELEALSCLENAMPRDWVRFTEKDQAIEPSETQEKLAA